MSSSLDRPPGELLGSHLRTAGYLVLGAAAVFPLLDLVASLTPASFGNATWRFGAVGLLSNFSMGLSLELFLMVALAAISNQRRVLLLLGTIALFVALCLLGSATLFVLDTLQTRARVTPAMVRRFDFAAAGALAKLLLYAVGNIILSRGALLAARRRARAPARAAGLVTPIVVGQTVESGKRP